MPENFKYVWLVLFEYFILFGLADDARLLERILKRNQLELRRYLGKPSAVADAQNR